MSQELPDPGFAITLKDIYREASALHRMRVTEFLPDSLGEAGNEVIMRKCIRQVMDMAKMCSDPRMMSTTQELRVHQQFLLRAHGMLKVVVERVMTIDIDKVLNGDEFHAFRQDILQWLDETTKQLQITYDPEPTAEVEAPDAETTTENDDEVGVIIPFGGN